jgi:lipopolysaccharide export system protein LptA
MNAIRHAFVCATLPVALILNAGSALAERADRDRPINLEANRITIDEAKKVQIFEGNVHLVQGSMTIRADKIVVSQDAEGFQKGTAHSGSGRLATFRQKREGKDEYIDGQAERIEYNSKAEKLELFGQAHVKSGLDEVQGQYISYDGKTENYLVTGGSPEAGKPGKSERVRAVIQPKQKESGKPSGQ